ncbi:MAG: 5'-nucleotidase C-terminal domain-containing protein [Lachnospiraceae bacterium]|nr:5'-nucleotidase C-terminal domain-containing protein [Lachnospiraceae bacterium]
MKIWKQAAVLFLSAVTLISYAPAAVAGEETIPAQEKQIQILQTSDLHGMFMPYTYATLSDHPYGSLSQVASAIRERRDENTILIDVGDIIQGNSAELFLEDEKHPMIEGLNFLDYDYWVAGNHEFNFGVPTLLRIAGQFQGKFLCGNVLSDGTPIGLTWDIKEVDGVKVAVIGMVTPGIVRWDAEKLKSYEVINPADILPELVEKLKPQSDVILLAYHAGTYRQFDMYGTNAYDIAEVCPDIDVILAAHGHEPQIETTDNGILLTENKDQGETLTDVDITLEPDGNGGWKVKEKRAEQLSMKDYPTDEAFAAALSPYDQRARDDALTEIAQLTGGDLVPQNEIAGIPQSQLQATSLTYLINSVQRHYADADVSATAVMSKNANIQEGRIRRCDLAKIYEFDNTLYKLQMTGKQLKQFMESSASYYNTLHEGDLTISFDPNLRIYLYDIFLGVNYDINISKDPGNRIENLTREDGTPIQDSDVLTVAVNNYRADAQLLSPGYVYSEGDELPILLEKDVNAGAKVRELIELWFTKDHYKGVVTPDLEENWRLTGITWDKEKHERAANLVNAGLLSLPTSTDGRTINTRSITEEDIKPFENIDFKAPAFQAKGGKRKIKLSIKPAANASRYIVSCFRDKAMTKAVETVETEATKLTLKKLKPGKKYFITVQAVLSLEGKEFNTDVSSPVKVKVK